MKFNICLIKNKKINLVVCRNKHKIIDLIGILTPTRIVIDSKKLQNYLINGFQLSNTIANLLYKNTIN